MGTGGTIGEGGSPAGGHERGIPPRSGRVDPFDLFKRHAAGGPQSYRQNGSEPRPVLGKLAVKSLRMLNLEPPASRQEIKASFKSLVKRHHPDANGGDNGSEDRLREIIQAYNYLKQAGLC
jgi:hypothetical protein